MQIQEDFGASFHFAVTQSLTYETGTFFFCYYSSVQPDYELLGVVNFSYCILVQTFSNCFNTNYE